MCACMYERLLNNRSAFPLTENVSSNPYQCSFHSYSLRFLSSQSYLFPLIAQQYSHPQYLSLFDSSPAYSQWLFLLPYLQMSSQWLIANKSLIYLLFTISLPSAVQVTFSSSLTSFPNNCTLFALFSRPLSLRVVDIPSQLHDLFLGVWRSSENRACLGCSWSLVISINRNKLINIYVFY